jgi:hypothetical protein
LFLAMGMYHTRHPGPTMRQLININPTSMHGIYLRLVVSNGAGL